MKIGDMVKLYNVMISNTEKYDTLITRIKYLHDNTLTTTCGISWWVADTSLNKGSDYEILSFSDYLRLIKI